MLVLTSLDSEMHTIKGATKWLSYLNLKYMCTFLFMSSQFIVFSPLYHHIYQ